jgi:hypothetical protein
MNRASAANISLALAGLGWLSAFYCFILVLADPSPSISQAQIEAHRQYFNVIVSLATVCFVGALGLSLYSYSAAKWRASFALLLSVFPLALVCARTINVYVLR